MKQYAVIVDSHGRKNVWSIADCFKSGNVDTYGVCSRNSINFIEKDLCVTKEGSTLLYYNSDRVLDVGESDIQIESKADYKEWIKLQKANINPFTLYDEIDLGYLEDDR